MAGKQDDSKDVEDASDGLPKAYSELHGSVLEMFHFQRLVFDELHEACRIGLSSDREELLQYHAVRELRAANVWGLTATPPISSADAVRTMSEILHVGPLLPNYICETGLHKYGESAACPDLSANLEEAQRFLDHFARRNTWDETAIPVEHHFVPVRHTRSERALYLNEENRAGHGERLLRLCTHFEPDELENANGDAAGTVEATQLRHRQELQELADKLFPAKHELEQLRAQAKRRDLTAAEDAQRIHLARSVGQLESWHRDKESCLTFFENTIKAMKLGKTVSDGEECSICLDDIVRSTLAILPCGHCFHRDCVTAVLKQTQALCPWCRAKVNNIERDVISIDECTSEEEIGGQEARYGTKLAKVIEQARKIRSEDPQAKSVVFVQWDTLLRKVHSALVESGLPCLILKGNIFQRQQSLRRFEESPSEDHAFLLLSLESSTSGMNLTVANYLFLVHPCLVGNRETAVAYEQQAIGRLVRQGQKKTVHVYRFVTEGTLEEKITNLHQKKLYEAFKQSQAARSSAAASSASAASSAPAA